MALTKQQKESIVNEVSELFSNSKLTVIAKYSGVDVKSMQSLRRASKSNKTIVKVVKNRLVIKAMAKSDKFKDTDISMLKQQLLYAFNDTDDLAPAKDLSEFAKQNINLEFIGAINTEGEFISANDVKELANLPSKDVIRAQLVGTLSAPLNGFVCILNGNLRGFMNVLDARSNSI